MFRHTRVSELRELKGAEDGREIGNLTHRFQVINAKNILEYRPSWISENNHIWKCIGELWSFMQRCVRLEVPVLLFVCPNDYEENSSCDSMEEDETVPNTPTIGGSRLVLPAPLPISNLKMRYQVFSSN
ncbi:hypothetical protein PIB30_019072 [Stylosanthes scabra]|uniref:Uncharacterized protein n=1 Tax=Stylosanthes scabra TaxID=79078 RepID=A0ABU6TA58_9FABA|nr:hypothetical protein [Stylosanthes scabra]